MGDDQAVVLDSNAVGLESKSFEQVLDGSAGTEFWKLPCLAVDQQLHALNVTGEKGQSRSEQRPQDMPEAVPDSCCDHLKSNAEGETAEDGHRVISDWRGGCSAAVPAGLEWMDGEFG